MNQWVLQVDRITVIRPDLHTQSLPPLLPPHLLTQCLKVQGLQFLGHLSPPVAEPAVKVGRLEEMPSDTENHTGVLMMLRIMIISTTLMKSNHSYCVVLWFCVALMSVKLNTSC